MVRIPLLRANGSDPGQTRSRSVYFGVLTVALLFDGPGSGVVLVTLTVFTAGAFVIFPIGLS
jgi:hypothetical protein